MRTIAASVCIMFLAGCATSQNMRTSTDASASLVARQYVQVVGQVPDGAKELGQVTAARCYRNSFAPKPTDQQVTSDLQAEAYALGANSIAQVKIEKAGLTLASNCWQLLKGTALAFSSIEHTQTSPAGDPIAAAVVQALPTAEEQNRAFIQCLIKKNTDPKNIPKAVEEACLSQAGVPDPGKQLRQLAKKDWQDCLYRQAVALDDGVSPADSIGRAIVGMCNDQWKAYAQSLWVYPEAKEQLTAGVNQYGLTSATRTVLLTRKVQKNRPRAPDRHQAPGKTGPAKIIDL